MVASWRWVICWGEEQKQDQRHVFRLPLCHGNQVRCPVTSYYGIPMVLSLASFHCTYQQLITGQNTWFGIRGWFNYIQWSLHTLCNLAHLQGRKQRRVAITHSYFLFWNIQTLATWCHCHSYNPTNTSHSSQGMHSHSSLLFFYSKWNLDRWIRASLSLVKSTAKKNLVSKNGNTKCG